MLGEKIPAGQALEWGLINRVVADGSLAGDAELMLEHLAGGPTKAFANFKRLINKRVYAGFEQQLDAEAEAQREQGHTADFIEGVLAFVEKRPAKFKGG